MHAELAEAAGGRRKLNVARDPASGVADVPKRKRGCVRANDGAV